MEEVQKPQWVQNLLEDVSEMFSNTSIVKFKTHKNRKVFVRSLLDSIEKSITDNTAQKSESVRGPSFVRPHPDPNHKERLTTVMTEGDSARGDDSRFRIKR